MPRKKNTKRNKKIFLKVLLLAAIWILVILMFVVAVFSYGMRQAVSFYTVKTSNELKTVQERKAVGEPRDAQEADFRKFVSDAESYIRSNFVSIARENNAGDDKTVVEDINFINVDRALVFYRSDDKDRYLAELVFGNDNGRIKLDRFILKMKNDTDYSRGVYGAD